MKNGKIILALIAAAVILGIILLAVKLVGGAFSLLGSDSHAFLTETKTKECLLCCQAHLMIISKY